MMVTIRLRKYPDTIFTVQRLSNPENNLPYHDGFQRWYCDGTNPGEKTYYSDRYWEEVPEKSWKPYRGVEANDRFVEFRGPLPTRVALPENVRARLVENGLIRFEEFR